MRKVLIWGGSVIGAAAVLALAFGALERNYTVRTLAVTGECLTTAPKDKAAITLRVSTVADTAVDSMQLATNKMAQITELLKKQPVEMQTTQFNSYEKTEWNRETQKSEVLGIETTIAVEISADNVAEIEKVLGQFAGDKNVFTENLRMYSSPEVLKPITEKCLAVATENARERANALAAGDNVKAGKILSLSYGTTVSDNAQPTNGLMRTKMVTTASAFDAAGTIIAKETDVAVSVSAVFEIK